MMAAPAVAGVSVILDNIERRSNPMAKSKTKTCPECGGGGVVPDPVGRYTQPGTKVCPTCGGDGVVPADEGEQAAQEVEAEAVAKDGPAE